MGDESCLSLPLQVAAVSGVGEHIRNPHIFAQTQAPQPNLDPKEVGDTPGQRPAILFDLGSVTR
jgi:hypothetical protein